MRGFSGHLLSEAGCRNLVWQTFSLKFDKRGKISALGFEPAVQQLRGRVMKASTKGTITGEDWIIP